MYIDRQRESKWTERGKTVEIDKCIEGASGQGERERERQRDRETECKIS